MKLAFPGARVSKRIVALLNRAFDEEDLAPLLEAVRALCGFYNLDPPPSIRLTRKIDGSSALAGICTGLGRIRLLRPSVWKRNRRHNTRDRWVTVVLHELGHFVLWANAEDKADWFADRIRIAAQVGNVPTHFRATR